MEPLRHEDRLMVVSTYISPFFGLLVFPAVLMNIVLLVGAVKGRRYASLWSPYVLGSRHAYKQRPFIRP